MESSKSFYPEREAITINHIGLANILERHLAGITHWVSGNQVRNDINACRSVNREEVF